MDKVSTNIVNVILSSIDMNIINIKTTKEITIPHQLVNNSDFEITFRHTFKIFLNQHARNLISIL